MDNVKKIEVLKNIFTKIMYLHDNYKLIDNSYLNHELESVREDLLNILREDCIDLSVLVETEDSKLQKTEYVKIILIYDELKFYHELLTKEATDTNGLILKYQYVKSIMSPLSLVSSNLKTWSKYHTDDEKLISLHKVLKEKLIFANHLRNKISGHLENQVIGNSIQWEPLIFNSVSKTNKKAQKLVMYRSLLESAINSYVDEETGMQKIFKKEIDLNLPKYAEMFFEYLYAIVNESMTYLELLSTKIDSQIKYYKGMPINLMESAGKTDFRLKAKGR